jgi:hypothetical protein
MVCDREKMSSVLDSASHKSKNLARIFKKVFNICKNAGQCNRSHLKIFTPITAIFYNSRNGNHNTSFFNSSVNKHKIFMTQKTHTLQYLTPAALLLTSPSYKEIILYNYKRSYILTSTHHSCK